MFQRITMPFHSQILFVCLVVYTVMAIPDDNISPPGSAEERSLGSGLARSMLADIAKELIARSGTNSQVKKTKIS